MEFDEEQGRRGIAEGDPLPPDEWQGFCAGARVEAIYGAHGAELARYLRRRAPAQDVGDLVQECFRRLVQSRGTAVSLIDRPAAYLIRTARNLLAERARADGRRMQADHAPFEDDDHAGPDPHAALEARDTIRRLADVVARLKPKTRTIFLMHRLDGLSSVEVSAEAEHWLLSDGHWAIRLDLHEGTLLGGPLLIEHRMSGLRSLRPRLTALRQLASLAERGALAASLMPREQRAAQWIVELRVADAMLAGASHQEMARRLFRNAIAQQGWRVESAAYRSRIQRLVRRARARLADPLGGPWFAEQRS